MGGQGGGSEIIESFMSIIFDTLIDMQLKVNIYNHPPPKEFFGGDDFELINKKKIK